MNEDFRILIVDDEEDIRFFLSYNLSREGYAVETAENGIEAIVKANDWKPHLILMDVMMPEMDGVTACKKIRKSSNGENIVIAFLSAKSEDEAVISGLDSGGDDYISKPVRPRVLIQKIKSLLKRVPRPIEEETIIKHRNLIINQQNRTVKEDDKQIDFPKKEYALLLFLVKNAGKVIDRETIFKKIWGTDVIVGDRTIDVHIRKLRSKLGTDIIKTVKGVGYILD